MDEPEKKKDEEYELIPISPLRRLEKRLDQLEHASSEVDSREFYRQLVEIIRMNQQLVDELAKANDALRIELSKLPARLEDVANKLSELLAYIKSSAGEDISMHQASDVKPLIDKMEQIVESNKKIVESNQSVISSLEEMERRMKRPLPPLPGMKKPLFPAKPI